MILRSWLADWRRQTVPLLGLVSATQRVTRRSVEIQSTVERLEERRVLTTIDLGNLGSAGITIFGVDGGDTSGYSVSDAGDVNGDGFDDLLIGAEEADGVGNAKYGSGESYIVFGKASLPATIDLANLGSAGVTIFGADEFDSSGRSVSSAGDVNGDGFADVLIGAKSGGGVGNSKPYSGESYVLFGSASLPATINLGSLGSAGVRIFGADANDQSGYSVSRAGDVNGDGNDDLLISAWLSLGSGNAESAAGECYVIFGNDMLPAAIDLGTLGAGGVTLFGADVNDYAGISVSGAGDVNGDGFDDFLIGADGGDGADNLKNRAGDSYLIFGSANLPTTIDLGNLGSAGVTVFGAEATDVSGSSVSNAGDVNGDGFDDVLISAPTADVAGVLNAGKTYVLFGAVTLPAILDLANLGTAGVVINGIDANDRSGTSVSNAGDVNGDGFDDILIGALLAETMGGVNTDSGESYLVFGAATLPQSINLANLGTAGITFTATDAGDNSGRSVSHAGDVNDDGLDDFLIGARHADGVGNAKSNSGETYLIFGAATPRLNLGGTAVTYVKRRPPVAVLPQVLVENAAVISGGSLTLNVSVVGTSKKLFDKFVTPSTNGLGSSAGLQRSNGQLSLVIQFNATTTASDVQSFLRGITFATKGKGLKTLSRTLHVSLTGGNLAPTSTIQQTINVRNKA